MDPFGDILELINWEMHKIQNFIVIYVDTSSRGFWYYCPLP